MAKQVSIPYLDPNVQHVGISKLRALNVAQLEGDKVSKQEIETKTHWYKWHIKDGEPR